MLRPGTEIEIASCDGAVALRHSPWHRCINGRQRRLRLTRTFSALQRSRAPPDENPPYRLPWLPAHGKRHDDPPRKGAGPRTNANRLFIKYQLIMKYFRLLSLAACFALLGGAAHAQILQNHAKSHVIFVNTGGEKLDSAATEQVIAAYYNTIERGFQQSGLPRFILSLIHI